MPKKFDDMVAGVWSSIKGKINPKTKKPFSESDAYAMATAKWKAMGHKAPSREGVKDWHIVEWFIPIQETSNVGRDFLIKGTAINETTTRNGIKYIAKELELGAPSFRGKPILLDHVNSVKNIVGRTTENVMYSVEKKAILFEAKIMDKEIQNMINDGRITDVSIGAKVQDLVQNKDNKEVIAVGIEGLEISLVAVPGDPGANIGQAFEESFKIKESFEEDMEVDDEKEDEEEDINEQGPRSEDERARAHFNISDSDWNKLTPEEKKKYINKLPLRGNAKTEQMITCPGCGMKYDMDEKKWSGEKKKEEKLNEEIIIKLN